MDRGNGDVGRVRPRPRWQSERSHESGSQITDFTGDVENGKILNGRNPFSRCFLVAGSGFVEHKLGDIDIKVIAPSMPPFLCDLLMTGTNQISAVRVNKRGTSQNSPGKRFSIAFLGCSDSASQPSSVVSKIETMTLSRRDIVRLYGVSTPGEIRMAQVP